MFILVITCSITVQFCCSCPSLSLVPSFTVQVTSTLSQSGLAHLEQACAGLQVAVSGGEQQVKFELRGLACQCNLLGSLLGRFSRIV